MQPYKFVVWFAASAVNTQMEPPTKVSVQVALLPVPPVRLNVPLGGTEYDPGVSIFSSVMTPPLTAITLQAVAAVNMPPETVRISPSVYAVPPLTITGATARRTPSPEPRIMQPPEASPPE